LTFAMIPRYLHHGYTRARK